MTSKTIIDLNNNISVIQSKLFDFCDGIPSIYDVLKNQLGGKESFDEKELNKLGCDEFGHYYLINPVCPECGSELYTKQGFRQYPLLNSDGKEVKIDLQRYRCSDCGVKYSGSIVHDRKKIKEEIREKIIFSKTKRGGSLRDLAYDVNNFLGIPISHQTIKNYLNFDVEYIFEDKNTIKLLIDQLSGHYVIDEEFDKVNGKRVYRVTIHDAVLNIPIAERLMDKRSKENLKSFIEEITDKQPLISITTDGLKAYASIAEELGCMHQLCIFHFFQLMNDLLMPELKKNKYSNEDKVFLVMKITEMRNIFRTYDINTAVKRVDLLLDDLDLLPTKFIRFINNHILKKFDKLTSFMINPYIPRTSNQAERYYRGNKKHGNKTKYRTIQGIIEHLKSKMWVKIEELL